MKQELVKYIKQFKVMSLSTYGEHPWVCWVFFIVDDNLNFYFSSGKSKHLEHIQSNNKVALGISDSAQTPSDILKGVQLWGLAEEVTGVEQLKWFFKMWQELINNSEKKLTYKNYVEKIISSKIYKVTPNKIQWFNKEFEPAIQEIEFK